MQLAARRMQFLHAVAVIAKLPAFWKHAARTIIWIKNEGTMRHMYYLGPIHPISWDSSFKDRFTELWWEFWFILKYRIWGKPLMRESCLKNCVFSKFYQGWKVFKHWRWNLFARHTNITALTVFFLAVAKYQETNSEQQLNQWRRSLSSSWRYARYCEI